MSLHMPPPHAAGIEVHIFRAVLTEPETIARGATPAPLAAGGPAVGGGVLRCESLGA